LQRNDNDQSTLTFKTNPQLRQNGIVRVGETT